MRALLSVSDKTELLTLARALAQRGFELVSTGGTARSLTDGGLMVRGVSDITGFPEMLDGRVKTLHPAVHGGILARRDHPDDLAAIAAQGIAPIDIVVVNLYPFAETAARKGVEFDDVIENIDIGGPSLIRAAAKNFGHVLVVVDPGDYGSIVDALDAPDGPSLAFRFGLAQKAFAHTARYDATIATTLAEYRVDAGKAVREGLVPERAFTSEAAYGFSKIRDLRYGENPHQPSAWYADSSRAGLGRVEILQGKELSFTNLLDLDAAARIVLEFDEAAAAVIKHTNPCGVATGDTAVQAYRTARDADALSAFGGIVGLNRTLDAETARVITETFIEAVIAPAVAEDAREILAKKSNMRVVVADTSPFGGALAPTYELRSILGAMLIQQRDVVREASAPWGKEGEPLPEGLRVVTARSPTPEEWQALRFAWRVAAHVKSNTVIFTNRDRTLAIGAGQMSRVDAVNVAVMKATGRLTGSVAASDAFFPFRDGLDAVARAGATAVVQPGGSVRDQEVIAAADEHGIAMVFTGKRHFRH